MCTVAELNYLQRLKHRGVRFIITGDFEQHQPIGSHVWCGQVLPADCVEQSEILQNLCDCNKMELRQNHRSDETLFEFYTSLIRGGRLFETPLSEILKYARAKFPRQPGFPTWSLTISNAQRRLINKKQGEATKPKDAVLVQATDGPLWLFKDLKLIGHLAGTQRGVINSGFYTVEALEADTVVVRCELTQKTLRLPMDFVKKSMRNCFALTQYACQGLSLQGRVRIHADHPRMDKRKLYVCTSRCTAASLLEVV
jgi:hypothetical protein